MSTEQVIGLLLMAGGLAYFGFLVQSWRRHRARVASITVTIEELILEDPAACEAWFAGFLEEFGLQDPRIDLDKDSC